MKKHLLALSAAAVLLAPQTVGAEGFGIVEWSAEGMAMGGARMFAENDAANVALNPASITKNEGKLLKIGATWLSPHDKYENESGETGTNLVNGVWVPHGYYTQQMTDKDWFGIGAFTRFGMTSEWNRGTVPAHNGILNELVGMSITPTYAHKFDDKWSAAVGAEINYVKLNLEKELMNISGDTIALGWNAAVNYTFDDKNEIGLVYRSEVTHSMDGDWEGRGALSYEPSTSAYGEVTLPESYTIGYGHKFDDKTRMELQAMRTNWSSFDALNIQLGAPVVLGTDYLPSPKNWQDGWRYAIGLEHKLSDKYSLLAGFAYDESGMPDDTVDFMIPTGIRRTYSLGTQYHDDKQTLGVTFGWMFLGDRTIDGHHLGSAAVLGSTRTYDNIVKMFAVSYQFKF